MFSESNTRIIFTDSSVVVLRELQDVNLICRIFIDGIEMGFLKEMNGILVAESQRNISAEILSKINKIANRSKVA
ncbi:hypothetical protein [Pedobacter aquatilis]|uniref:hypothetical protein n=1 Tax=Pedobacter aquatilis TaxID=351343 RepID=UPI00292F1F36|nr:hypothetical protein [Pedobacter aquatilis]